MEKYKTGRPALQTNMDSRWTKDLNGKGKNYKVSRRKAYLCNLKMGGKIQILKARIKRQNIDKFDYKKRKDFYLKKDTMGNINRHITD